MQLISRKVRDDGEDFGQIREGFLFVEFTGSQDGVGDGRLLRCFVGDYFGQIGPLISE